MNDSIHTRTTTPAPSGELVVSRFPPPPRAPILISEEEELAAWGEYLVRRNNEARARAAEEEARLVGATNRPKRRKAK